MIPAFTHSGVLPPFVGEAHAHAGRSPYPTTMQELVARFGTTPQRRRILRGLSAYRRELRRLGFIEGFQWVDGSFIEDVETLRQRPPGDIDVVTFVRASRLNEPLSVIMDTNADLFDPALAKETFCCDAYIVDLDRPAPYLVQQAAYWSSLFAHQRSTLLWKGILRIDLADDDEVAGLEEVNDGSQA